MIINWPIILFLFCISVPGCFITIPRLIHFLLPDNTEALKKRISHFALLQTLILAFIMCYSGALLSQYTRSNAPILEGLLDSKLGTKALFSVMHPAFFYSIISFGMFYLSFYVLGKRILRVNDWVKMNNLHRALGVDGCILYGGIVEEIIGRWGLMNLAFFFIALISKSITNTSFLMAIFISSILFSMSQLPLYLAAGCQSSRTFIYFYITLSTLISFIMGFVFWQFGLLCSMACHILFHCYWAAYCHYCEKFIG